LALSKVLKSEQDTQVLELKKKLLHPKELEYGQHLKSRNINIAG